MNTLRTSAPSGNVEFDEAYGSSFHWMWSDTRIPCQLKEIVDKNNPDTSLEFGCGLGRFSQYMAGQKIQATGVDFSTVAIDKAQKRVANDEYKPIYLAGDVTNLNMLTEPFDVSFDIGCFHCLNEDGHRAYASEVCRLLKSRGVHLIWALDKSPADIRLTPDYIKEVFGDSFRLEKSESNRRRILASHWYWLRRK